MGRVIDAHVHFWNPGLLRYPWLAETPTLRRAFLPEHFAPLADGAVDGVIVVEANCESSQAMTEVEFVDGLTAREPRVLASVAYVDLLDEDSRGEKTLGGRGYGAGEWIVFGFGGVRVSATFASPSGAIPW